MKLRDYIITNEMTLQEAAEKIGIHRTYFSQIMNFKKKPSYQMAKKISDFTDGKIKIKNILDGSAMGIGKWIRYR